MKKKTGRFANKDKPFSPLGNSKCMWYPLNFMQSMRRQRKQRQLEMNKSGSVTDERPYEADCERGGTSVALLSDQGAFQVMSSLTQLV